MLSALTVGASLGEDDPARRPEPAQALRIQSGGYPLSVPVSN